MLKQIDMKIRHSGLDPESSSAPLALHFLRSDSGLRRNDGLSTRFNITT